MKLTCVLYFLKAWVIKKYLQSYVDRYIVVLNRKAGVIIDQDSQRPILDDLYLILNDDENYHKIFNYTLFYGFCASMSKETFFKIKKHRAIKYAERDQTFGLDTNQRIYSWGLERIEAREKYPYNNYFYNYKYHENSGENVNVYVIDSGVYVEHEEFEGRATVLENPYNFEVDDDDQIGHGTHVAGIISGKTHGVSKKANIISIKVTIDDSYTEFVSKLIKCLEMVIEHVKYYGGTKGNIINMSLGTLQSFSLNLAMEEVNKNNIIVVTSAGNDNKNACLKSPASADKVITVGATDINDNLAVYSNYGSCVNILAPGTDITSASIKSRSASMVKSGTSMAAPHITGLIAYIMSMSKSSEMLKKDEILTKLRHYATKDKIKGTTLSTPNLLAFNYLAPLY